MAAHYDDLETRSPEARARALAERLPAQIEAAQQLSGYETVLDGIEPETITDAKALAALPLLRKSEMKSAQSEAPPLGGFAAHPAAEFAQLFQSPGPLYEPAMVTRDWWRIGRFLHACGIGRGDILQNCFSYHLTPAGAMFESGARAVGAAVLPAGTGQTELQVRAAHDVATTAYAGTPDFLKSLLEKAEAMDLPLRIDRAAVSSGALYPSLRAFYTDHGIDCRQCYATAELGNIAYESEAMEGLIVDEGVIVEIVAPGTGDPVPEGEIGEVLVTTLNPDYPLIRFATGDLSALMPGPSPCGRTNTRIRGWLGRVDEITKVRGVFVRPEQVAQLVARHREIDRVRVVVTRDHDRDVMIVQIETAFSGETDHFARSVSDIFKLRGDVDLVPPRSLPRDGKVIDDQRRYD